VPDCGSGAAGRLPSRSGNQRRAPASGNPSEKALTDPNGACLELRGVKDMVLENRVIGPCGGNGIEIWDSENITIRNVVIKDTTARGIYMHGSKSIDISESEIRNTISGIYAISSTGYSRLLQHDRRPARAGAARPVRSVRQGGRRREPHQLQCRTQPTGTGHPRGRYQPL
jgi:parallel beta-helix repeat protein